MLEGEFLPMLEGEFKPMSEGEFRTMSGERSLDSSRSDRLC